MNTQSAPEGAHPIVQPRTMMARRQIQFIRNCEEFHLVDRAGHHPTTYRATSQIWPPGSPEAAFVSETIVDAKIERPISVTRTLSPQTSSGRVAPAYSDDRRY